MRRRKGKRGPVVAKKCSYDGIKFQSNLEMYMYKALKEAGIEAKYEGETFVLQEGFMFENDAIERQSNGKGEFKNRGNKKILPIKYTPDFIGEDFILEVKGRANETFPLRYKMFKKYVKDNLPHVTLYKPQKQDECDEVIKLILNKRKEK